MPVTKKPSNLDRPVPNFGPGLFADERDIVSSANAHAAAAKFLQTDAVKRIGVVWDERTDQLGSALGRIARQYWADFKYDNETTFAQLKPEIKNFEKQLRELRETALTLSHPALLALNKNWSRPVGGAAVDRVADLCVAIIALEKACAPITKRVNERGRPLSVEKASAALWDLWESITGRRFIRQWQTAKTPKHLTAVLGPEEFVGLDANFVQTILRAIDSDVTVSAIRDGLRRTAAKKNEDEIAREKST